MLKKTIKNVLVELFQSPPPSPSSFPSSPSSFPSSSSSSSFPSLSSPSSSSSASLSSISAPPSSVLLSWSSEPLVGFLNVNEYFYSLLPFESQIYNSCLLSKSGDV